MGLRLDTITVEGFGSYGPKPQTISFGGRGPVAVVGDNGAGKSTIVSKALTWCLYGKSAPERMGSGTKTLSGKSILNPDCKEAIVEVSLVNSIDSFKIKRQRKKTGSDKLTITQIRDGQESELDANNDTVSSIVGADWFVFTRTVLRGQGDLWSFAEATDKSKRELLDVVSGAIVLEQAEARAKAIQKTKETAARQYEMLASATEDKLAKLDPKGYAHRVESWDESHKTKIDLAEKELASAIKLEEEAIARDVGIDKRKQEYQNLVNSKPHLDLEPYHDALKEADRLFHQSLTEHRTALKDLNRLKGLIPGDANSECPTCGQSISKDAPILDKIESAKDLEKITALETEPYDKYREECQTSLNQAKDWLNNQTIEWQRTIQKAGTTPSLEGPSATRYRKEIESRVIGLKDTKNPYREAHEQLQKQSAELLEELTKHRKDHVNALSEFELSDIWLKALSPKGVRAHLAEAALCAIEAKANEWLTVLSEGKMSVEFPATREVSGRTKEEIKTTITSTTPGGEIETRDLLTYSGGERKRINLAVDLGVAAAFSHSELALSLLILDEEVFSGMDEAGKAGVVQALHSAGIEDVVVIDHDPRLSSTLPRTIEVSRGEDGFSQVLEINA